MSLKKYEDYLTVLDGQVREGAKTVSLVGEIPIPAKSAFLALRIHAYARTQLSEHLRESFTYRHRHSLIAGVVAVARDRYKVGSLWPAIDDALAEQNHPPLDPATRSDFRTAFIEGVRGLGLPTVGDGNSLVDTAAMHAGIPTYCLDDWFNLTTRARRRVGDDPAEMTRWAVAHRSASIMGDIDQPIKRMLVEGPEFAADLFDRAALLMDSMSSELSAAELADVAGADISEFASTSHAALESAEQIGLDARWVVRCAANLSGRPQTGAGSLTPAVRRADQPSLHLDFAEGALQVSLPAVHDVQAPVEWIVGIGEVREHVIADLDLSGEVIASRTRTVSITRPVRVVTVGTAGRELPLSLWAGQAPVIAFAQSGRHLASATGTLPGGPLWLLVPATARLGTTAGELEIPAEDDAPLGWSGWRLVHVIGEPGRDLTIAIDDSVHTLRLRGGLTPRLTFEDPVPGVRSFGLPVHARRPRLTVPAGSGDWRVTVTRRGEVAPVWARTITDPGEHELMTGLFSQVGTFEIAVRGSLGHGLQENVNLVDGLQVHSAPEYRTLDSQGKLGPATITASAGIGVTVKPTATSLEATESLMELRATNDEGRSLSMRYRPAATLVGWVRPNGSVAWGPRPVSVDSATLSDDPSLLVRLPASSGQPRVHAVARGRVVQALNPGKAMGALRYRLGELAEAVKEHGAVQLFLPDGQPVGHVAPRAAFREAQLVEGGTAVHFSHATGLGADVEAWIWWEQAAWRPATMVPLTSDRIALPAKFQAAGPLLVHVRRSDPWVPQEPPVLGVGITRVHGEGGPLLAEDELELMAVATGAHAFLSASSLSVVLDALAAGPEVYRRLPQGATARLRAALHPHAPEVARLVAERDHGFADLARGLVSTGLHRVAIDSRSEAQGLWAASPRLASILAGGCLVHDGVPDRDGADELASDMWRRAALDEFGPTLLDLVDGAPDSVPAVGRFDESAARMEAMPAEQGRRVIAHMEVVPTALLDRDSRVVRSLRVSSMRESAEVQALQDARQLTLRVSSALAAMGAEAAVADIQALTPHRQGKAHHWIPALTRAVAWIARLAARCDERAAQVAVQTEATLLRLVEVDPAMVVAELARAEALVTASIQAQPSIDEEISA